MSKRGRDDEEGSESALGGAAGRGFRCESHLPGPVAPGAVCTEGSASSLPHPDKMRERLVDKDGRWRDDVDWPTIEQELKDTVAAFVDLLDEVKYLALSVADKKINKFMLNYNDFLRKAMVALRPAVRDKQEYLLRCAQEAAGSREELLVRVIVRDGRHFVASSNAYREIMTRSIRMGEQLAQLPIVDETEQGVSALPWPGVVTVLSGESGSGKTMALLTCIPKTEVGVYLTNQDLKPACDASKVWEMGTHDRDTFAQTTLCTVVANLLRRVAPDLAKYEGDLPLTVALDEMSSLPEFVRGLCACHDAKKRLDDKALLSTDHANTEHANTIAVELKKTMGLPDSCLLPVTVVVAGTGVDALAAAPGSLPETFRVVRMQMTTDTMVEHLVSHLKRLKLKMLRDDVPRGEVPPGALHPEVPHPALPLEAVQSGQRLAEALVRNAAVVQLCHNPRFAAALYECAELKLVGLHSERAADAFVLLLVPAAVWRYKQLNGMRFVGEEQMWRVYEDALKLVFSGAPASVQGDSATVVRKYGVLTDRARWVSTEALRTMVDVVVLARDPTHNTLVSPPSRFVMSGAQQQLFRMHYGFRALPDSTWMGYEDSVADYLFAALLGCHGRTLGYLLTAMSPKSQYVAKMDKALLEGPLNYAGVCRFNTLSAEAAVSISGASTEGQLADLAACMEEGQAVVVVNAPRAPYADVVVMIPNVAVLLVQCKFYRNLSAFNAGAEVAKMRDAAALLGAAKCEVAIPVIVTTKAGVREDGTFVLWETSTDESLAPLGTPMPQHGRRSDEPPAKRELVSQQATTSPSAEVEQQTIVV